MVKLPNSQPSTLTGSLGEIICFFAMATFAPIPIQRVKANADIVPLRAPFQLAQGKNIPREKTPRRGPANFYFYKMSIYIVSINFQIKNNFVVCFL